MIFLQITVKTCLNKAILIRFYQLLYLVNFLNTILLKEGKCLVPFILGKSFLLYKVDQRQSANLANFVTNSQKMPKFLPSNP